MGQTISGSFVWTRGEENQPGGMEAPEDVPECASDVNDLVPLPLELCNEFAVKPERKTAGAAGFDVCSAGNVVLAPHGGWVAVNTAVRIAIGAPSVKQRIGPGAVVYGAIRGRSGLTSKGIEIFHGTVDADFT